jgi:hypothetical protein
LFDFPDATFKVKTLPNSIFPSRNVTQRIHLGILRPSLLGLFRFPFSTRRAEKKISAAILAKDLEMAGGAIRRWLNLPDVE